MLQVGRAKIPVGDGRGVRLAGIGERALLAPDHLAEKRRRCGLAMALGPAQRRGRQGQRRDTFTTGNAFRRRIRRLAQRHEIIVLTRGSHELAEGQQ